MFFYPNFKMMLEKNVVSAFDGQRFLYLFPPPNYEFTQAIKRSAA